MTEFPLRLFFSPQSWFSFQDIYTENKELFSHLDIKTIKKLQQEKVGWGYKTKRNKKMVPHSTQNRLILLEKNERFLMTKGSIYKQDIKADCTFRIEKWGKKRTLLTGIIEMENRESIFIHQIILYHCDHLHVLYHALNELFSILTFFNITYVSFHTEEENAIRIFEITKKVPSGCSNAYMKLHSTKKKFSKCQMDNRISVAQRKRLNKYTHEILFTKNTLLSKAKMPKNTVMVFSQKIKQILDKCHHPVDYLVWTDGGVKNKSAAISFVIRTIDGKFVKKGYKLFPSFINSAKAELNAILHASDILKTLDFDNVLFLTDFQAFEGMFKKIKLKYKAYSASSAKLLTSISHFQHVSLFWISREWNMEAHNLCEEAFRNLSQQKKKLHKI